MADAGTFDNLLQVLIGADMTRLEQALTSAGARVRAFGQKLKRMGRRMTLLVSGPLAAIGAASTKAFATFDSAMTESLAIMGDVSDTLRQEMVNAARRVASETTKSATKAAESYFFLASAGLDAKQSVEALPAVARFAQAGMFDMATATDIATDAQSALGLTSQNAAKNLENMKRVTDALVAANQEANASVQQFGEALTNRLGARLRLTNKTVEEGAAALAALADQGVKGRVAGRRLNIVLRDLGTRANKNAEAFEELGVQVFDATGEMRAISEIIEDVEQATAGMSSEQRDAALETLKLNKRAQDVLVQLTGTSDAIREYRDAIEGAGGATREVADRQMRSFSAQVTRAWNQVKILGQEIGDNLAPAVLRLARGLRGLIEEFRGLSDEMQAQIVAWGVVAALIGPVVFVVGQLITALSTLVTTLVSASAAVLSFGASWAGIAAAGVAAVAAIITHWDSFKRSFFEGVGAILRAWNALTRGVELRFEQAINQVKLLFGSVITFMFEKLSDLTTSLPSELVPNRWFDALTAIGFLGSEVTEGLGQDIAETQGEYQDAASDMERAMEDGLSAVGEFSGDVADTITTNIGAAVTQVQEWWDEFVSQFEGMGAGIVTDQGGGQGQQIQRPPWLRQMEQMFENARQNLRQTQEEMTSGGDTQFQTPEWLRSMNNMLANARQNLQQTTNWWRQMGTASRISVQTTRRLTRGLFQELTRAATGVQSIGEAFENFGNIALRVLSRVVSRLASAAATAATLQAAISLIPGVGSIGGVSGFGSLFSSLVGFQSGGIVTGPTLGVLGEGNEKEAVLPLSKLGSMMGGGGGLALKSSASEVVGGHIVTPVSVVKEATDKADQELSKKGRAVE